MTSAKTFEIKDKIMSDKNLQILEIFATSKLPDEMLNGSKIGLLIKDLNSARSSVISDNAAIERARKAQKDGNFIGNWWNDRADAVQDAQLNLNKSIGNLTEKSSELLVINTILAKVLNDQQKILYQQQKQLEKQADDLAEQNDTILKQQEQLETQQKKIEKANQGLMEARGVTQEQAHKLVGCVKRVEEAENKIDAAHEVFRLDIDRKVQDAVTRCNDRVDAGFSVYTKRHDAFESKLTDKFSLQAEKSQKVLDQITAENSQLKSDIQEKLSSTINELGQHQSNIQEQVDSAIAELGQHQSSIQEQLTSAIAELGQHQSIVKEKLISSISELDGHRANFERDLTASFADQSELAKENMEKFTEESIQFKNNIKEDFDEHTQAVYHQQAKHFAGIEDQLIALRVDQQVSSRKSYFISGCAAILAIAAFCWEMAQHGWITF